MAEIVIDEKIRSGKPVLKGTRFAVDEILRALASATSSEEIEREYKIKREGILAALKYATKDSIRRAGL